MQPEVIVFSLYFSTKKKRFSGLLLFSTKFIMFRNQNFLIMMIPICLWMIHYLYLRLEFLSTPCFVNLQNILNISKNTSAWYYYISRFSKIYCFSLRFILHLGNYCRVFDKNLFIFVFCIN